MVATVQAVLLAVLAVAGGERGGAPRLANERMLKDATGQAWRCPSASTSAMRLTPDGEAIIYVREESVAGPDGAAPTLRYRLMVHGIASGQDTPVPILPSATRDYLDSMLSVQLFDATGRRIVLSQGIDLDDDGVLELDHDRMCVALYDLQTGRLETLSISDDFVFPTYNRTGDSLVVMTLHRGESVGSVYAVKLDNSAPRKLGVWGFPWGVCPTADLVCLLLLDSDGQAGPYQTRFVLYDLVADQMVAELPSEACDARIENFAPVWTADGQHLYYVKSVHSQAEGGPGLATRVWSRAPGAQGRLVRNMVPISPGPTESTVVMTRCDGAGGLILHDAGTGRLAELGDRAIYPVACNGRRVLFNRTGKDGTVALYRADIVLESPGSSIRPLHAAKP